MEIDTGDSPPITQKTLYSSFKTCHVGIKRTGDFGESWSDSEKCLTLG